MKLNKILNRFSVAVLAKSFFIKNLFHLITTLRCSNIDQEGLPTRPHIHTPQPNPTNTHTHTHPTQGKRRKRKREKEKRGKGPAPHHTPHHNTSTHNLHSYYAPHPHHTQREREKREREGGSLCVWSGYDVWYGCGLQANALWCGVMWCSAGEEKKERREGERGERGKKEETT